MSNQFNINKNNKYKENYKIKFDHSFEDKQINLNNNKIKNTNLQKANKTDDNIRQNENNNKNNIPISNNIKINQNNKYVNEYTEKTKIIPLNNNINRRNKRTNHNFRRNYSKSLCGINIDSSKNKHYNEINNNNQDKINSNFPCETSNRNELIDSNTMDINIKNIYKCR